MADEPKAPELDWLKAFDKDGHWAEIASHSQNVMAQFFRQATEATALTPSMSQGGLTAFANLFNSFLRNPQKIADAQTELLRKQGELLNHIMAKAGVAPEAQSLPSVKDRRFRSEEWDKNLACNALMHSYLIGSEWLRDLVANHGEALTPRDRKNVAFYTNQIIDAASPGNFLLTNPDALKKTVESRRRKSRQGPVQPAGGFRLRRRPCAPRRRERLRTRQDHSGDRRIGGAAHADDGAAPVRAEHAPGPCRAPDADPAVGE